MNKVTVTIDTDDEYLVIGRRAEYGVALLLAECLYAVAETVHKPGVMEIAQAVQGVAHARQS